MKLTSLVSYTTTYPNTGFPKLQNGSQLLVKESVDSYSTQSIPSILFGSSAQGALFHPKTLSKTGIQVSGLGIGTWQLVPKGSIDGYVPKHRDNPVELIQKLHTQYGINFLDTAAIYGDGKAEEVVQKVIAPNRNKWVIASKLWSGDLFKGLEKYTSHDKQYAEFEKRANARLKETLQRLKIQNLDVYLFHKTEPLTFSQTEWTTRFLKEAKAKGLVKAIGVSTNDFETIRRFYEQGALDVAEFEDNLLKKHPDGFLKFLEEKQIGCLTHGSLAHGLLTSRRLNEGNKTKFQEGDIRNLVQQAQPINFDNYKPLLDLQSSSQKVEQAAIRYLLDNHNTTTHSILSGGSTFQQYQDLIEAFKRPSLSESEQKNIKRIKEKLKDDPYAAFAP